MPTVSKRRPRKKSRPATKKKTKKKSKAGPRLSRTRRPEGMSLDAWQRELRRQHGSEQDFELENVGEHPFFSEFHVTNSASDNQYRVAIRGTEPGDNYCSCPDFATNTLGTCKHIEFTLARLRRKRGAKGAFAAGYEPPYSEVYLRYGAVRDVRFRAGSECPRDLARLAARYFDDEGVLRDKSFGEFQTFLSAAGEFDHELRCYDDALRFIAEMRDAEHRYGVLANVFRGGVGSAEFDRLLNTSLYEYQREGALFACQAGRTLLADDMGLGKTVQAIAAAEIMARHFGVERVLIVCPTSLKHQWEREIGRFTDRTTQVIGGLRPRREEQYAEEAFYKIANYDTVHRDLDLINGYAPDLVILDEAQRIKNWETRTAKSVKKIDSTYCIVLTGTPLENRLEELVSLVQFVDQQRLGPTFRFLDRHQDRDPKTGRVVGYRHLDEIGQTLEPILLRRRKDEVLDQLPERMYKRFFVPMTELQWKHHEENREIVAMIAAKWRRYGFLSEIDQRRLMIALQNMRMSCNSTYLLDHKTDHSIKPDEVATLLAEVLEEPGSKAVVFSQWVRMHELIQRRIDAADWNHVFFHGGVDGGKRKGLIDQFREDPGCRVFLSTDAGGVGLNLQHANVVINMDMPWNPAVLEQRIGRVHRLGQTRPVHVVDFVASDTIEQGMLEVLSFKKGMFAGVLDGGEKEVFLGTSRLKKFMETVDQVTSAVPPTPSDDAVVGNGRAARDEEEATRGTTKRRRGKSSKSAAGQQPASLSTSDALTRLLQSGLAFLQQMTERGASTRTGRGQANKPSPVQVSRDEQTGRQSLKIELPEPEVIDQALAGVKAFLEGLRE